MAHYDLFSRVYDASVEQVYLPHRARAAEWLDLSGARRVLDAGCGTGLSFGALRERMGEGGELVGLDGSEGMLARARARANALGASVSVRQGDLLALDDIAEDLGRFDRIVTFLVLSSMERHAEAFAGLWSLLEPGGRFLVVDAHAERLGLQGRMVNLTARADIRRRVWEPLEAAAQGFRLERFEADWRVGGDMVFATGTKATS
jgi:demethylmenaquinone methyltransferase/2-methoxy-6-polyprenyl-1,4-benzoquinol methylase